MNPDFLINGVLSSVLGGGRKRSRRALRYLTGSHGSFWTRPTTLLTAAGVAWGIYETLQGQGGQQRGQWGGGAAPAPGTAAPVAAVPPLPGRAGPPAPNAAALFKTSRRLGCQPWWIIAPSSSPLVVCARS